MTHDRWKALCQNLRSPAPTVWELWCFEDWKGRNDLNNELIDELVTGVFVKAAQAPPGVLNIISLKILKSSTHIWIKRD